MQLAKQPMYLKSVTFKARKKADDKSKMVVASLMMQPFDRKLAEALAPGVTSKLFARDGQPVEDVLEMQVGVHCELLLVEFRSAPDLKRPTIKLDTVELSRRLKVRRDKETPQYAATLQFMFDYPDADDLLMLVQNINSQFFISVEEQAPQLREEDTHADARRRAVEEDDEENVVQMQH